MKKIKKKFTIKKMSFNERNNERRKECHEREGQREVEEEEKEEEELSAAGRLDNVLVMPITLGVIGMGVWIMDRSKGVEEL